MKTSMLWWTGVAYLLWTFLLFSNLLGEKNYIFTKEHICVFTSMLHRLRMVVLRALWKAFFLFFYITKTFWEFLLFCVKLICKCYFGTMLENRKTMLKYLDSRFVKKHMRNSDFTVVKVTGIMKMCIKKKLIWLRRDS